MASKARQSVFGGFFGLSLNFVILPFFMRLRSSCGYDADHVAPHCISDEEHSSVDETDSVETQFTTGVEIIILDHIRVQEHFRSRSKVDTVFLSIGLFLSYKADGAALSRFSEAWLPGKEARRAAISCSGV